MLDYGLDSPYDRYKPKGVNPCGEVTLSESDSCRLIAVNLFSFVENPFTEYAYFNTEKFYEINYEAMVLSDDLVDLEVENIDRILNKIKSGIGDSGVENRELGFWEKIKDIGKNGRRTGLGITGLGDTLAALGLKYDSDDGISATENIMKTKMRSELDCTIDMSILRGKFTE